MMAVRNTAARMARLAARTLEVRLIVIRRLGNQRFPFLYFRKSDTCQLGKEANILCDNAP